MKRLLSGAFNLTALSAVEAVVENDGLTAPDDEGDNLTAFAALQSGDEDDDLTALSVALALLHLLLCGLGLTALAAVESDGEGSDLTAFAVVETGDENDLTSLSAVKAGVENDNLTVLPTVRAGDKAYNPTEIAAVEYEISQVGGEGCVR